MQKSLLNSDLQWKSDSAVGNAIIQSTRDPQQASLEDRVIETIELYAELLELRGQKIRVSSPQSLRDLALATPERKLQICAEFERKIQYIVNASQTELSEEEFYFTSLRRALEYYGYWIHADFWKILDKDDIVEFYGENMTQLFSSANFFYYSAYSLLDICLYEWFTLWERPKKILEQMHGFGHQVLSQVVPVIPFAVTKHVLREVYDSGNTQPFEPRATRIEFKYIGSLMRRTDVTPKGFICTCRAEVVAWGNDALNLEFI